jgi:hypothetical protein
VVNAEEDVWVGTPPYHPNVMAVKREIQNI